MLQEGTGVLRLLPRGRVEGRALGLHEVIQSGPLQLLNPRQSSCREREREREGGRGGGGRFQTLHMHNNYTTMSCILHSTIMTGIYMYILKDCEVGHVTCQLMRICSLTTNHPLACSLHNHYKGFLFCGTGLNVYTCACTHTCLHAT